jgi:hypothetical protein
MSTRRDRPPSRSRKRSALAELGSTEKAAVLDELLRSRPELRTEAERVAREYLIDTDVERVAEAVAWELQHLSSDELVGRAGKHRWGYVEPTEAAWELLEEAVGTFDRELERLIKLDMIGPAVDTALGAIGGLYRCRGCEDGDVLLSWAPDFPLEHAGWVVDNLAKAGIEPPADLIADLAPEWADRLMSRQGVRA